MNDLNAKGLGHTMSSQSTENEKGPQNDAHSVLSTVFQQWKPYHSELQEEDCLDGDREEKTQICKEGDSKITNILWAPMNKKKVSRMDIDQDRPSLRCRKILFR